MDVCRICLADKAKKDIFQPKGKKVDESKSCVDIIMFCLDIKVEKDPKISTKLCHKCYNKLYSFHEFKSLALKTDAHLKSLIIEPKLENETCGEVVVEIQVPVIEDSQRLVKVKEEIKDNDFDAACTPQCQPSNEYLNNIKLIKCESIQEKTKPCEPDKIEIDEVHIKEEVESVEEESNESATIGTQSLEIEINNDVHTKPQNEEKAPANTANKQTTSTPSGKPSDRQMCEDCGKWVKDLKKHSLQHQPDSLRARFPCSECSKTFANKKSRRTHYKMIHLGFRHKCTLCNKMVVCISKHHRIVHNAESLPFGCVPCGRRFTCKSALEVHLNTHTQVILYSCDTCDKKFTTKGWLNAHKRLVHNKEKSHVCPTCSKSYFRKHQLEIHMRSHTGEKPFECADCGKTYRETSSLKRHRLIHENRRFACDLCDMTFKRKDYLSTHKRRHMTMEMTHKCQYCDFKFVREEHCKRHEYSAHQKKLESADD